MRRIVVVTIVVVALLGALSPPASAQAPAPKVTINGIIDTVTRADKNVIDSNFAQTQESTWHTRNRGVFTITGEVGKAKGVLALEIDVGWGQQGTTDSAGSGQIGANSSSNGAFGTNAGIAFTNGGMDLGIDSAGGVLELKNLYVEFPVPWIPFPTVARLGGQPTQVTMKPGIVLTTDYPGVWLSSTIAPWVKVNFTYAQVEEQTVGMRASSGFYRGDDYVIAPSVDLEPMKGVKIRPFWVWFHVSGNTFGLARCRVLCAGLPSNGTTATIIQASGQVAATTFTGLGNYRTSSKEERHFLGVDAQTNFGPFYFDPSVVYLTSNVDVYRTAAAVTDVTNAAGTVSTTRGTTLNTGIGQGSGDRVHQKTQSWLIDVRGGWRAGPLLLEGLFIWSPGDAAQHDSFKTSKYYNQVSADGGYQGGWAEILTGGSVDYLQPNTAVGEKPGFGKYGILRVGGKAGYALTPAFTLRAQWNSMWTDTKVDTDAVGSVTNASYGGVPCAQPVGTTTTAANACRSGHNFRGDDNYIGTEIGLGATYAFAPGLTFDIIGAYLFAGSALDTTYANRPNPGAGSVTGGTTIKGEAQNSMLTAARVRYQF